MYLKAMDKAEVIHFVCQTYYLLPQLPYTVAMRSFLNIIFMRLSQNVHVCGTAF